MKKILIFVMIMVFCLTPVTLFSGCNKNENFWEVTYNNVLQFNNNEKYSFVNNATQLSYNQIISDEINNSESVYSSLQSVYNNISVESLRVFNKYKNSLQIKPSYLNDKNSKTLKKYFEEFDKSFEKFVGSCDNFIEAQNYFNTNVTQDLNGDFALQKLKDYKRNYYNFILDSVYLSESLLNLYVNCYQSIETDQDVVLSGSELLANYSIMLQLTKAYVYTELMPFDGLVQQTRLSNDIYSYINTLALNIEKQPSENLVLEYKNWVNQYQMFNNEFNKFFTSVENISLKALAKEYNYNEENYLAENQDIANYYLTYNNAKTIAFPHIVNTTNKLFT